MIEKIKFFLSHLFIPSEDNNYRAKTLQTDFLSYYLILSVVLVLIYKTTPFFSFTRNILGIATDISVDKLFQLSNQERINNGLQPLTYNDRLAKAAEEKAKNMFVKNYWAHYAPDGTTPWEFILSSGYKYEYAGENLAKDFMFSDGVVKAWMDSKTHRENILRPNYDEIGFAVINGVLNGEETTLVVQMFGKPLGQQLAKNESAPTTIVNTSTQSIITPSTIITPLSHPSEQVVYQLAQKIGAPPALASEKTNKPLINIKMISYNYALIIFFLLILTLISDLYFAYKLKIVRLTGKHIAHFIFISFVLISLVILTKGVIL
jgi:uncharacterized protein YkwD